MNIENRRISLFGEPRYDSDRHRTLQKLGGFTANPWANAITAAQAQLYQAAFLKAQEDVREAESQWAECWN